MLLRPPECRPLAGAVSAPEDGGTEPRRKTLGYAAGPSEERATRHVRMMGFSYRLMQMCNLFFYKAKWLHPDCTALMHSNILQDVYV